MNERIKKIGLSVFFIFLVIVAVLVYFFFPLEKNISEPETRRTLVVEDARLKCDIAEIVRLGGSRNRLVAKIAGGAQMFAFGGKNDSICVGERNVLATKKKLNAMKIPILAEDTGKTYGRTVVFFPKTGDFHIRSVGKPEKIL